MKIKLNSVFVDDQDKALKFYTDVLGFVKKRDIPAGKFKWLTVVSSEEPDGTELVLEPDDNPAAKAFKKALYEQGIPLTAFAVEDVQEEYERMKKLGVVFRGEPAKMGQATQAVFDDTCGNLIQIYQTEHKSRGLIARASITISAPIAEVWDALVNPDKIKQYMFGTNAVSDWKEGSPVVWKGEWQGKKYEDRGVILKLDPGHRIQYSHFSPVTGQPDLPENYHIVTIELSGKGKQTLVSLLQDNNATEEAREHSEKNWKMMLGGLKEFLEKRSMTDAIIKLFAEYEKAFNALEVEKQVPLFAEHFISAGPRGIIALRRDEFARMASEAAKFYRSVGQTSAKILSMDEIAISTEYSSVKVHWGATFEKTGNKLIEFDVTYFIQKTGPEPKIIMFIAHQDEEKAMKELGLLGNL